MKSLNVLIIVILFICSCAKQSSSDKNEVKEIKESIVNLTDAQLKNASLELGKIEEQTISSTLKVNGKIDVPPQNMVSISAQLGGYLKSSQLLPGMKVKKGEVIATMEDQQYIQIQQDYLTTKTKLNYLEKEYNRQKDLNESKATSDKVFQQTEADYFAQKITLKALYEKLKLIGINPETLSESSISRNINIYAPIDGYVTHVNVNIGKYVNPSEVLFELVNPTDIHLALTIFEKDIPQLFIGQKVIAYTNNEPEKKHNCEIILISQHLSDERSVEIHCHFNNYDKTLLPGMYMNAEIEITNKNSSILHEPAIVNFENKHYVFVQLDKHKFEMKEVFTGMHHNGVYEITNASTLKEKTIVTKGAYTLLMALKNTTEE
jgi:cobalt-zinc-cadmium efflux system membrane fusion protein